MNPPDPNPEQEVGEVGVAYKSEDFCRGKGRIVVRERTCWRGLQTEEMPCVGARKESEQSTQRAQVEEDLRMRHLAEARKQGRKEGSKLCAREPPKLTSLPPWKCRTSYNGIFLRQNLSEDDESEPRKPSLFSPK